MLMLSNLGKLGNYRYGKIIANYKRFSFIEDTEQRLSLSKMQGDEKVELLPEKDEPKRPPYKCGIFNSKFEKAERSAEYFKRARTSLDSVFNLFEENKDEHTHIPFILDTYKDIRYQYLEQVGNDKKYPLIVFEGLDGSGKSSVCKKLAKKIGAEILPTPPKSLSSLREKFDGDKCWHAPFYYFGNYVAALEVSEVLKSKPVVMDRFWHSTTAFALAQMKEDYYDVMKSTEIPEKGSNVYKWPDDLLKPDIVIFLDVSEAVRKQRLSKRVAKTDQENLLESKEEFRKNVVMAYENMENPGICKVNANSIFKYVLQQVEDHIKELL